VTRPKPLKTLGFRSFYRPFLQSTRKCKALQENNFRVLPMYPVQSVTHVPGLYPVAAPAVALRAPFGAAAPYRPAGTINRTP